MRRGAKLRTAVASSAILASLASGIACGDSAATGGGGAAATGTGGATTSSTGGQGGNAVTCIPFQGPGTTGTDTWQDGTDTSTVSIGDRDTCTRSYSLYTTASLRDSLPSNPRQYAEAPGQSVVRTGNDMFDALYALAIEETRQASVDSIHDGSFNGGNPLPCPAGGCFETGEKWTYVWTRDTAYSTELGLGPIDPTRTRNSLEFKTSFHRDGTKREIVQDTGTGGSWPISSDRVVWAQGAWELLKYLSGDERTAFRDLAYEAMTNTAERDRLVVYDAATGLYRGEQSFLDWREQTYPAFTATDTVQIGMSESLGTNVGHLRILEVAAALATEKGDAAAAQKYAGWADSLRTAIGAKLWLPSAKMFSSFLPSPLDPAPVNRFDLLGEALAVISGAATPAQAADVVASYPHFPKGAPVIFPEQQDTPIYHNRSIWPFVTAFWAKAAAQTKNADAIDLAVRSLVRGAAMNLSHMENFEAATGKTWVDEGPTSGPVVDSTRQLWSVAGYLSMVHDVVFGLDASQNGIRFLPKITTGLRKTMFAGADVVSLSNFAYKGKRLSVRVHLPPPTDASGVLDVASVKVDGADVGTDFVDASTLSANAVFDVELANGASSDRTITLLDDAAIADYQNVFGPRTPSITGLSIVGDRIQVAWDAAGETAVAFNVYRDGALLASNLPAGTASYLDMGSPNHATRTYCYSVEAVFTASGNASQHARAACYWGATSERVQSFGAQGFTAVGGVLTQDHGKWHYDDWGNPGDTITVTNVVPAYSGKHWLQVNAGNGSGGFTTGITCAVKAIEVWDGATLVASGQLVMPQLGTWDDWRDSNLVPATLQAGKAYTVIIREDAASGNMSDLAHFSLYGGTGGMGGRFDKVNIAELKLLALGVP